MTSRIFTLFMALISAPSVAHAAGEFEVQRVADGIYALVGELGQRSPDNFGNNATFGAVVTNEGVVLIDSGGSRAGAEAIERAIRQVTDKPVIAVFNTGGQDHRWLGNGYFKAKGARIIAADTAVADQKARLDMQYQTMTMLIGAGPFSGTQAVHAEEMVSSPQAMTIGGTRFELIPAGQAHTPGSLIIWLPDSKSAFAGDIVYVERMLGVIEVSRSQEWIAAFENLARLEPRHVIPGHGHATTLEHARADTHDYLVHLRRQIGEIIKAGGDLNAAAEVDQAAFLHLRGAGQLARRNAMQVFVEMEFE